MNFSSSSSSSSSIGRRNSSSTSDGNENDHHYSSSNLSSSPSHPSQLMFNNNQSSNPIPVVSFSSSTPPPPPPPISSYNPSIYFHNQNLQQQQQQQQSLHLLSSTASSIVPPLEVESKPQPQPRIDWNTGLCDCFLDGKNCCITCWCPCVTFGKIAEIVDRGSSSCGTNGALYTLIACVTGFPCFFSCFYRSKLRQQYRLKKSPCCDCLTHFCCSQCSLCQEYRELQSRGYNMAVGWHGNLENRRSSTDGDQTIKSVTAAPTVEESMKK